MLAVFTALAIALASPAVVDRVVTVVDEEIVLDSDLRLELELAALDEPPLPFWRPSNGTVGQRLEDAAILRLLAAGVALYDPSPSEVQARIDLLRARAGGEAAWAELQRRWGLDDRAMRALVRRRMVVERYLVRNLTEDPARTEEWLAAANSLLEELRPRYRIRHVPPRAQAADP